MSWQRSQRSTLAILVAAMLLASACGGDESVSASSLAGIERDPAPSVATFSLPAVNRNNADFVFQADPGGLLLVYFGFTNCPDFCPTTLSDTRIALNELGPRAGGIDVAVVTIDPERDTSDILSEYVTAFIADGIALRTEDQVVLSETAFAFGADYRIETDGAGEIEVGHTTNLFAVDERGTLVLTWPFGISTDDLLNDLTILLDRVATT